MFQLSCVLLKEYMKYHRRAMGVMKNSHWAGAHGALSHYYNRTGMREEVKPQIPVSVVDREMMHYVHHSKIRHFQLWRSYTQKSDTTQSKLIEGAMLRRRWNRKLQKAFIAFMQYKTMKVLEDQAKLINMYGQASVNAALGDPQESFNDVYGAEKSQSSKVDVKNMSNMNNVAASDKLDKNNNPNSVLQQTTLFSGATSKMSDRQRKYVTLQRQVRQLPTINLIPKHVPTMKQIHNDRFDYRWRIN